MFGKDIFNQESLIKPNAKVISYNIQDFDKIDVPLSSAISKIVEIEKDKTNIFNLSINYPYPPETEAELGVYVNEAMKIDRYIQLNNIVLVNSAGNVGKKLLKRRIKEPDKNEYLSVSSPAFSPNVFSVGSVEQDQKNLSLFGLVGSPFNHKSENNLSPPQIFAFGGDTNGNKVWCLSKNDSVCSEVGTSFSAPLVSLACRKAMDLFFPNFCKNAESVKAMVLNSCTKVEKKTDVVFVLDDPLDIGLCHDSLKFNFEGKLRPEHKAKDIKKKLVDTHKGEFYVPKEAQSIEFTLVYSHNYYLRRLSEDCVFPKIKISGISKNSKREIINSNLKTPNGQIVYGEVAFKKNHHGKWYFELYFDGKGIPPEFRSSTLIRYGLAIKINLGSDSSTLLRKTYSEAVKEMHLKEIKDPLEEQVTEKILSNIQTFQKHTK